MLLFQAEPCPAYNSFSRSRFCVLKIGRLSSSSRRFEKGPIPLLHRKLPSFGCSCFARVADARSFPNFGGVSVKSTRWYRDNIDVSSDFLNNSYWMGPDGWQRAGFGPQRLDSIALRILIGQLPCSCQTLQEPRRGLGSGPGGSFQKSWRRCCVPREIAPLAVRVRPVFFRRQPRSC